MTSPITFVNSATGATNSATVPANTSGDLAIAFSFRDDGTATAPSLPSGWTNITQGNGSSIASRTQYKVLDGTTPSVTFTNATSVVMLVYRINSGWTIGIGDAQQKASASGNVQYNVLTMTHADGTSWVAGFAGHTQVDTALETPPTGMTFRAGTVDATDEAACHDTNGGVSSWATTTVVQGGTSGAYRTTTVEVLATQLTASGTLAATESGSDTAAMTGTVKVQGTLAATESGADTASMAGKVAVKGTLAASEAGADTAAIAGTVKVTGTLAAAESGADTASMAGQVKVQGSLAASESGADVAAMAGQVKVQGTLAASESGADTAAFSGKAAVTGTLAATESGADTAAMTGQVKVTGILAAIETGADTCAMTGQIIVAPPLLESRRFTVQPRDRTFRAASRPRYFTVQQRGRTFTASKG